jgi:hypothetical protein
MVVAIQRLSGPVEWRGLRQIRRTARPYAVGSTPTSAGPVQARLMMRLLLLLVPLLCYYGASVQ